MAHRQNTENQRTIGTLLSQFACSNDDGRGLLWLLVHGRFTSAAMASLTSANPTLSVSEAVTRPSMRKVGGAMEASVPSAAARFANAILPPILKMQNVSLTTTEDKKMAHGTGGFAGCGSGARDAA